MTNLVLKGLGAKVGRFVSWFVGSRRGPVDELEDIPLVVFPLEKDQTPSRRFVVFYSGDGGWANLTGHVARALMEVGIPTVGVDSMRYFWGGKTAQQTAEDLERIIAHFSKVWGCEELVLIGYSMGADVLPEPIGLLREESRKRVQQITLIGMSQTVDYKFRFAGWLGYCPSPKKGADLLRPHVHALAAIPLLCICGEREHHSLCRSIDEHIAQRLILPGGHHFGGDYSKMTEAILTVVES